MPIKKKKLTHDKLNLVPLHKRADLFGGVGAGACM